MGIITKIEDKLGEFAESPFRQRNGVDLVSIEISLKRAIEAKRKNILGKMVVPNHFDIGLNKGNYEENEPFFETFRERLNRSLGDWIKEKGYEITGRMEFNFKRGRLTERPFEIIASFKNGKKEAAQEDGVSLGSEGNSRNDQKGNDGVVGELINEKISERFKITQGLADIGRGENCAIRINDPTISRKHAFLFYRDGKIVLKDMKSKSGTRVNREKVQEKVLNDNDRIVIGSTELTFVKDK